MFMADSTCSLTSGSRSVISMAHLLPLLLHMFMSTKLSAARPHVICLIYICRACYFSDKRSEWERPRGGNFLGGALS